MNTESNKRIVVSLCLALSLVVSLLMILPSPPAYSRPSPGLHNRQGYKLHPEESGFHGTDVSESRSQPEAGQALGVGFPGEKELVPWRFPGLVPVLSFCLITGFLIILKTGSGYRGAEPISK